MVELALTPDFQIVASFLYVLAFVPICMVLFFRPDEKVPSMTRYWTTHERTRFGCVYLSLYLIETLTAIYLGGDWLVILGVYAMRVFVIELCRLFVGLSKSWDEGCLVGILFPVSLVVLVKISVWHQ